MTAACELRWCRSGKPGTVSVNDVMDDGSWRASICSDCAGQLGVRDGDDLPPAHETEAIMRPARRGRPRVS